jgi:hypothetical protein
MLEYVEKYQNLGEKLEGKIQLARPRRTWEDNSETKNKEVDAFWLDLSDSRSIWESFL